MTDVTTSANDGQGGEAVEGAAAAATEQAQGTAAESGAAASAGSVAQVGVRPDGLDDKFWDDASGLKVGDLVTRAITNKIINGSNATAMREFDGIKTRLTGTALTDNAAGVSGGAALSLYKLDRAIDKVMEPTHLMMSKAMRSRLTQAGRNTGVGGYVAQTKDDFGNTITTYRGLPILVGYEDEVNDTTLFPFDEVAPGGGSAVTTSIYVASMKEGMFTGLQVKPMEVDDLGKMQSEPKWLTRVEWDFGICIEHPSALHRLNGITDAAITA